MYLVFVIIIVLASLFLTLAVLMQNSKGGGLAANFGVGTQFGVRQTADFLEKATWTLAAVIIVCCILATATISSRKVETKSDLTKQLQNQMQQSGQPAFPIEGLEGSENQEQTNSNE